MLAFTPYQAEELINKHRKELYVFLIRRVACKDTVNDLLQDIFLRLVNLKSAEPIRNPRAFIYRIAANLATDHLRQRKETVDLATAEVIEIVDANVEPDAILFSQQKIELCEQALHELSPLALKIFVLSRFEGYTHKQIANELNISVSWVGKNIMTALKRCKQVLKTIDNDPS